MRNRHLYAPAALLLTSTWGFMPAFALNEKVPDECEKYLTEMSHQLNALEALVPNVPPDEASYLEKEYFAALEVKSSKRIYDVQRRPLYYAWILHGSFDNARRQINIAQQTLGHPPGQLVDLKFAMQIASLIPYDMANAKVAWIDFDNADNGKVLTLEQIRQGARLSQLMIGEPGQYIWCLAQFIK